VRAECLNLCRLVTNNDSARELPTSTEGVNLCIATKVDPLNVTLLPPAVVDLDQADTGAAVHSGQQRGVKTRW
jgi:hypothetical protein